MVASDLDSVMHVEHRANTHGWVRNTFRESLRLEHESWVALDPVTPSFTIAHAVLGIGVENADLFNLSVDPRHQGHGLGRQMLDHVLSQARSQPIEGVYLEVRRSNQRAIKLYESVGFQAVGERKNYYKHAEKGREDALVMRLRIFTQPLMSDSRLN